MKGWIVKLLTICNEVYCMGGGAVWGWCVGEWGLEINKIKKVKIQGLVSLYYYLPMLIYTFQL